MSKIAWIPVFLVSVFATNQTGEKGCALAGKSAWSEQLKYAVADCDNRFPSPNEDFILRIGSEGRLQLYRVYDQSALKLHSQLVEPPAQVSWSPRSDAFVINDGQGSGMASVLRLFRIRGERVAEDSSIEKRAVALFSNRMKCNSSAADPNVSGFGWSGDGAELYVLVQATVDQPCGQPNAFVTLSMRSRDDSILEKFSEQETKRRFSHLLPAEIFSK